MGVLSGSQLIVVVSNWWLMMATVNDGRLQVRSRSSKDQMQKADVAVGGWLGH